MTSKTWVLAACAALIAFPAHAQTADELIQKNIKAKGGMEKLKGIKSLRASGHMLFGPNMEAPFIMTLKRPNEMRMEFTLQGMTGIQAYDGKSAWALMPFTGKKSAEPMSPDETKLVEEQSEFDGPLVDYKAKGTQIEAMGRESVEGVEAYKLKLTRKNGDIRYVYLDPDAYLEIKSQGKRNIHGTELDVESSIGDYKDEGGIMMAHSVESGPAGSTMKQKITIDKFEINVDVPETAFAMPPASDSTGALPAAAPSPVITKKETAEAKPATEKKTTVEKKK